jgi:isopenicillin-N N-acyltransferase-like protein
MLPHSRRRFIPIALAGASTTTGWLRASDVNPGPAEPPKIIISGGPGERGRAYGRQYAASIRSFLNSEIYEKFTGRPASKHEMLRYAAACESRVSEYVPETYAELKGIAEGAGLALEEILLVTLHEELCHNGLLPKIDHCTAVAAGPPDTVAGHTYVGQTWDWMTSAAGLSSFICWRRKEGPSVLSYSYPGLLRAAGINSAGMGLTWVTVPPFEDAVPEIGVPTYVMVAHLLYQPTLESVIKEVRRIPRAGWFSLILADDKGHLANLEATPREVAVEVTQGRRVRDNNYGTLQMNRKLSGESVPCTGRCLNASYQLAEGRGNIDARYLMGIFEDPAKGIGRSITLDMMVFDTTAREAWISRGPSYGRSWRRFIFPS